MMFLFTFKRCIPLLKHVFISVLWLTATNAVAKNVDYHDGASWAKGKSQPLLQKAWLLSAQKDVNQSLLACPGERKTCQSPRDESEWKTLIEKTEAKKEDAKKASEVATLTKASHSPLTTEDVPVVGYCQDTHCIYSQSGPNTPGDTQALIDWLALNGTTHDFNGVQVLTGTLRTCRDTTGHYSQCCQKATGWGQDLHLAHCTSEEKALAKARQQGLCIAVGSRCTKEVLGQCVQHEKFYCCYGSMLLREVREGAKTQLNLGFGKKHHPNCQGISVQALTHLDFKKMPLTIPTPVFKQTTKLDLQHISPLLKNPLPQGGKP